MWKETMRAGSEAEPGTWPCGMASVEDIAGKGAAGADAAAFGGGVDPAEPLYPLEVAIKKPIQQRIGSRQAHATHLSRNGLQ